MQFERNLSDFIQKNSASIGNLEAANALRDGSRESTSFVSEQLAFQQTGRNRRTVEFDEGFRAAWAQVMNCARDQFLACARFSVDEHRRVCWRDGFHVLQNFAQRRTVSDDLCEIHFRADFIFQIELFLGELLFEFRNLAVRQRVFDCDRYLS